MQMQKRIMHLAPRRRNPDRAALALEMRVIRRELGELRKQISAIAPPLPWGMESRHEL